MALVTEFALAKNYIQSPATQGLTKTPLPRLPKAFIYKAAEETVFR